MERVTRIAPVAAGIGEWAHDPQELDERARPAVGEDQRDGVRLRRPHVQEMNDLAVDRGDELRQLVERGLLAAPVEAAAPVFGQRLEVVQGDSSAPARVADVRRPARAGEPSSQVVDVRLGNLDPEGPDGHR
jgi:hypothetical protein